MQVEKIKNHVNGFDTYIIGQWALLDGNLVIHKNDLFDVRDKYPHIEEKHLDDIRPLFCEQVDEPKKVMDLAMLLKNKGLYAMAIYMHKGFKEMDNAYLTLKKRLDKVKSNEIV